MGQRLRARFGIIGRLTQPQCCRRPRPCFPPGGEPLAELRSEPNSSNQMYNEREGAGGI
jgi:hypothetical protein